MSCYLASYSRFLALQLVGSWQNFWNLFSDMDREHIELDENKRELTTIMLEFLQANPSAYVPLITRKEENIVRVMDFFICLRANDREIAYNNSAVPNFYRIVDLLIAHDEAFLQRFSMHTNFDWAVNNIYFSNDYLPSTSALLRAGEIASLTNTGE